jgi:hypothetical protein
MRILKRLVRAIAAAMIEMFLRGIGRERRRWVVV